jgi:hypothetical protein
MDHAMIGALSERRRAVLTFYLDTLSLSTHVELYRATWQGTVGDTRYPPREHVIARIVLPTQGGAPVHFYGTLGDAAAECGHSVEHEHQFVSLVDAISDDVVSMLSHARAHHSVFAPLVSHSSFLLDEDNPMRSRGYTNILVARADLYGPFRNRNSVVLREMPTEVLSVVPLEPREWRLKVESGIDALFDSFRATGRDLLSLRARKE